MSAQLIVAIAAGAVAVLEFGGLITLAVLYRRTRRALRIAQQAGSSRRGAPRTTTSRAMAAVVGTALRVRDQGVGGLLLSSLEELTRWTPEDRAKIAKVAAPDGTVAIVFSDIEGSTALNEELGDERWVRVLEAHNAVVRTQVERRRGHVVKTQGDGFMVVFGDPVDAVQAAVGVQAAFAEPPRRLRQVPISVRIGVHVGPVVSREGDYFGRNVAFAARVAAEAGGGEILISDDVRVALGDEAGIGLEQAGEVELKGLADVHVLWRVISDGSPP
jgi:adenylate cyclase